MKAVLALLAGLLFWSQLAWGHASLLAASPAPGAVLERAPSEIVLTFSEPVGVTKLRLIGPQGQDIQTRPAIDRDTKVRIPLITSASASTGAHGTFLLSWRIVSADGHPVGGTLDYSVGAPSAQAPAAVTQPEFARDAAIWLTRWLTYLCLFATAGAALFRAFNPSLRQAWALPFAAVGLVLLPADLALQGLDLVDAPWTALSQAATWHAALGSTYAATLGLYALALLMAAATLTSHTASTARLRLLGTISVVLAGMGAASSGHVGTAPPEWLSRPLVTLHVIFAIAWIGLLIPLARALRSQPARIPAAAAGAGHGRALSPLAEFSRWILPAVILLALSGLSMAFLQLDRLNDLWQTHYGQVLLAKLCLVGMLLCLAAYNRWRLTPAAISGAPARRRLRRTITVEILLAALLLAVVSLWRFTPPPRSLDAGRAILSAVTLADKQVHAQVNPGAGSWHIRLTNPAGAPFTAQEVTLILDNPSAGIEPLRRKAQHKQGDLWEVSVPALPETGKWDAEVEILVDDFTQITLKAPHVAQGMSDAHMAGAGHAH